MRKIEKLKLKENTSQGITLIALIITIIILLILAGISIATLTGENGILKKASESNEKNTMAQAEEEIKLVLNEWKIEKISTTKTFQEFLDSKVERNEIDKYIILENGNIEIDRNDYYIVVDADGNILENIQKTSSKLIIKNNTTTLENGTEPEDYSQKLGTPLIISFEISIENGRITKIEPNVPYQTNGIEMEKSFEITYEVEGKEYTKTININVSRKYEIKEPEIIPSTTDWTNENLTVEVNYGDIDELYKKEISIDGGETYNIYKGPVEIEKNTTVKARIIKELPVKESTLEITNIDKLPPNDFQPSVDDTISSTELKIHANVTDQKDEENGCSGIKEYKYYVYDNSNLITSSELITSNTWNALDLVAGTTYDIVVEVLDYAGNAKKSEKLSYQKKEIYTWAVYPVTSKDVYYTLTSNYSTTMEFYNTDSVYNSSSIPPVSGANFIFSGRGNVKDIVSKWFSSDGRIQSATVIYYATASTYKTGTGYYMLTVTQKATRPTKKEYSRASDTPSGYVKSSNPNAYPQNAYQNGYWYIKQ